MLTPQNFHFLHWLHHLATLTNSQMSLKHNCSRAHVNAKSLRLLSNIAG